MDTETLLILAVAGAAVYYFGFYEKDGGDGSLTSEAVRMPLGSGGAMGQGGVNNRFQQGIYTSSVSMTGANNGKSNPPPGSVP